jgi:hypothetical protein
MPHRRCEMTVPHAASLALRREYTVDRLPKHKTLRVSCDHVRHDTAAECGSWPYLGWL